MVTRTPSRSELERDSTRQHAPGSAAAIAAGGSGPLAGLGIARISSQSNLPQASSQTHSDRFIPVRGGIDAAQETYKRNDREEENAGPAGSAGSGGGQCSSEHKKAISQVLGGGGGERDHRVLAFRNKAPAPAEGHTNNLKVLYSQNRNKSGSSSQASRNIRSAPVRVLDAPDILDDYYLNLLSWGPNDQLAVALWDTVYLWNASDGSIAELFALEGEEDYITSVEWTQPGGGAHLAVGTASAQTQLWDCDRQRMLRTMDGHSNRVSCLAWNEHIVSSGSRDSSIVQHDVRVGRHAVASLNGHEQEVCGLKWSPDGTTLASGGNDNLLNLWDARVAAGTFSEEPKFRLTAHQAAVKALAWCPFERNVLASGGGTADRCIKFWNSSTGATLNSVDTGSQVCSLLWSKTEKELVSSHGFAQNQLAVWSYPSMARIKELEGHTSRVLHMAMSPDGQTVVSAAADETLRFWHIFDGPAKKKKERGRQAPPNLARAMHLR